MDLIIEEQRNGYGAYAAGKDWSEPDISESTLSQFVSWALRSYQTSGIRLESCDDPTVLIMFLYRGASRSDWLRITITCENAADRDELAGRLMSMFNLDIKAPEQSDVDLRTGDAIEYALLNDPTYS